MAYDERLAQRMRAALSGRSDIIERERMGGLTFMRDGSVCARIEGDELVVRCKKEQTDDLLTEPGARRYEMKGKPSMRGWIILGSGAIVHDDGLARWLDITLHRNA